MKTALLIAALLGIFPVLRFARASETSAKPAATDIQRGQCILACQTQLTHCNRYCTKDTCACADQYDACVDHCEALP